MVPAETASVGDGDTIEGGAASEFASHGVETVNTGVVGVAPPLEDDRLQVTVRSELVADVERFVLDATQDRRPGSLLV